MRVERSAVRGGAVAALVALAGAWSCSGQVKVASGGAGGSASVGSHLASVSSTTGVGGIGGSVGAAGSDVGGGEFATSGGGIGGAGGGGCASGSVACAGVCTDLSKDPFNCGACGTVCSFPHANDICGAGACMMGACNVGWADCNHDTSDGCEVHVAGDPMNCGACGDVCTLPHATAGCAGGMCSIATCDSGWTDCNNDPADGCEATLQNDPMNCGACGNQCFGAQPCLAGACGCSCPKGEGFCPGDPPGSCCQTTFGTNQNCNFCNDVCALPNATSQCMQNTAPPPAPYFACTLVSCNAGFADCDMNAANGCEVDTTTDPANCGGCGNACASGQSCAGGVCQ